MSTFSIGVKIHQAVLPQRPALELTAADNPRVGTKRAVSAAPSGATTGRELGRGEIRAVHLPHERHSVSGNGHRRSGSDPAAPSTRQVRSTPAAVPVLDKHGKPLMPCHPARARQMLRAGRAVVVHAAPIQRADGWQHHVSAEAIPTPRSRPELNGPASTRGTETR